VLLAPFAVDREVQVLSPEAGQRFASQGAIEFRYRPLTRSTMLIVTRGVPDSQRSLTERAIWWGFSQDLAQTTLSWDAGNGLAGDKVDLPVPAAPLDEPLFLVVEAYERRVLVGVSAAIPFAVGKPWPARNDPCDPSAPLSCSNPNEALACMLGVCMRVCASYADCAQDAAGSCIAPLPPEYLWRVCR
jgi:hypothetical protein